jgi:hypothetical protein
MSMAASIGARYVPDVKRLAIMALLVTTARVEADTAFCELTPCVGPVTRRMLTKDEPVGALTCKKGTEVGVDSQGHVVMCTTARVADVAGLPIAAGAYTLLHGNGRIYQTHLRKTVELSLPDNTKVVCGADLVALTEDGKLRYCKLGAKRAGSPRARVGEGISFHPDGRIAALTLDEPFTVPGIGLALPAGAFVSWDAKGTPTSGYASENVTAGSLTIRYDFALHPNGKLRTATLGAAAKIQGHDFPEFAKLAFRSDGTLERSEHVTKMGAMPHGELTTDTLHQSFDASGKITSSHTDHWQAETAPHKFRK